MSEISVTIDNILRQGLSPLMKQQGFRKSGRNYSRQVGPDWQALNVQASNTNFGASGQFTVNLGVYITSIANLIYPARRLTLPPREAFCIVRTRLGALMPERDSWWTIEPEADLQRLAQEIAQAVEQFGLPWLDRFTDPEQVSERLKNQPSIEAAAAALVLGDRDEAGRRLRRMLADRPAAVERVRRWAQEQNLSLEG